MPVISLSPSLPHGITGSLQYRSGSKFQGDSNLKWVNSVLTINGRVTCPFGDSTSEKFGNNAGNTTSIGTNNIAIGDSSLHINYTGQSNIAIGVNSLSSNTSGFQNICLGSSLTANTEGINNIAIGSATLPYKVLGDQNIAIGTMAGLCTGDLVSVTKINNAVLIGVMANPLLNDTDNEIVIGCNSFGAGSNSVTLGNTSITKTILRANVGIGTTAPDKALEINSATGDCLRLTYNDANGTATYYSDLTVNSSGALTVKAVSSQYFYIGAGNPFTINAASINLGVDTTSSGSITPTSNNTYDLGSSTYKWKDGYFANGLIVASVNGIDINPGSDVDADLLTVGVTGTPKLSWDESDNLLVMSHALRTAGFTTATNGDRISLTPLTGNAPYYIHSSSGVSPSTTDQVFMISYNTSYDPITGWRSRDVNGLGAFSFQFESLWNGAAEWNLDFFNVGNGVPAWVNRPLAFIHDWTTGYNDWKFGAGKNDWVFHVNATDGIKAVGQFSVVEPVGGSTWFKVNAATGLAGLYVAEPSARLEVVTVSDTDGAPATWSNKYFKVGATGATGSAVFISYNQTSEIGYIGARTPGTSARDLVLQPGGGYVGIGIDPTSELDISGTVAAGGAVSGKIKNTSSDGLTDFILYNDSDTYFGIQLCGTTATGLWGTLAKANAAQLISKGTLFIRTDDAAPIIMMVHGLRALTCAENAYVGVGTSTPAKALEVTEYNGDCLRLSYRDYDGSATYYSDFTVSSTGILTITPSGGAVTFPLGSASAPSLTFTGDVNTGLYSPGADQVAIATGGTARVYVDASGYVGVGTTTPSAKLHVMNDVRIAYDASNYMAVSCVANGNVGIGTASGSTGGTISFYPANGSVYINSGSISNRLYVTNGTRTGCWSILYGDALQFVDNNHFVHDINVATGVVFNESGADLDFRVESDDYTHMLFVDADYNRVGIGSSGGGGLLTVGNNTTIGMAGSLLIVGGTVSAGAPALMYSYADAGTDLKKWSLSADISGNLNFWSVNDAESAYLNCMLITHAGNVGIGTASPSTKLYVKNGNITVDGVVANGSSVVFKEDGSTKWTIGSAASTDIFGFYKYVGGNGFVLSMTTAGYVGIGTTTPAAQLHVYGASAAIYVTRGDVLTSNAKFWYSGIGTMASDSFSIYTDSTARIVIMDNGLVRIARTTEQLRLGYSDDNYASFTVSSAGDLTIAPSGGDIVLSGKVGIGTTPSSLLHSYLSTGDNLTTFQTGTETFSVYVNSTYSSGIYRKAGSTFFIGTSTDGISVTGLAHHIDIDGSGKVGVGTTAPDKKLEVNSATGDCLRLTYNDTDGTATYYSDFTVSSAGGLTMTTSHEDVHLATPAAKTLVFDSPVWDDLRILPSSFDFAGSGDPSLANWQPGGGITFKVWEFTTNNEAFFTCQLPHSYKAGNNISAHVHWTPGDRGVAESGKTVAWKMDISWADINSVFPSSTKYDLTDTCTGVDNKHEMSTDVWMSGTGHNISSMLACRIYRDAGDTWSSNIAGDCPVLLEVDFHFPMDTVGSRTYTTK